MSINRTCLHAFHIVAIEGSFSKAAIAHHVSQPTLSAQVKELEMRYKVSLFERRGRGVSLTNIGRSLFKITKRLFDYETEAEQLLLAADSITTGVLRIGADSPYLVIPLMAAFQSIYPDIKVTLNFGNSKQLLSPLHTGQFDIIVLPGVKSNTELISTPIFDDRLIAFVNHSHSWATKRSIRLLALADQKIVLREKGSNTRLKFEKLLKQHDIKLDSKNTIVIGGREGVREAVAAGLGIGIVAESEFGHDKRLNPLLIRDVKTKYTEYIVFLDKRKSDPIIRAFMKTSSLDIAN